MASFTFSTDIPLPRTAQELQERIKSLFAIRTELDREIETMMGVKTEAAKPYHCVRCDYQWKSRLAHRPKMCPRCRIKKFDRPPLYTYEEKIARKKELLEKKAQVISLSDQGRCPHGVWLGDHCYKCEVPVVIPPVAPMAHSVLTRQVSTESDSIQNVMLTPPPEPDRPLSLRERLAQMKSQLAPEPASAPEPVIVEQSDDELVEAINNGDTPSE